MILNVVNGLACIDIKQSIIVEYVALIIMLGIFATKLGSIYAIEQVRVAVSKGAEAVPRAKD